MPRNFRTTTTNTFNGPAQQRLPQSKRIRFSEFLKRQNPNNDNRPNKPYTQQIGTNIGHKDKMDSIDSFRVNHNSHFQQGDRGIKRQLEGNNNEPQLSTKINDAHVSGAKTANEVPLPNFQPQQQN